MLAVLHAVACWPSFMPDSGLYSPLDRSAYLHVAPHGPLELHPPPCRFAQTGTHMRRCGPVSARFCRLSNCSLMHLTRPGEQEHHCVYVRSPRIEREMAATESLRRAVSDRLPHTDRQAGGLANESRLTRRHMSPT